MTRNSLDNRMSYLAERFRYFRAVLSEATASFDLRSKIALNALIWAIATLTLYPVIARVSARDDVAHQYWPWIRNYFFPDHRFEILAFAVVGLTLGLLTLVTLLFLRRPEAVREKTLSWLIPVGACAVVLNLFIASAAVGLGTQLLLLAAYATAITTPILSRFVRFGISARGAALAIIAEFLLISLFFAVGFFPISADYLQIPSTVLLRESRTAPPQEVDTISFINDRHLFGNQKIPDFRIRPAGDLPCPPQNQIDLPDAPLLQQWVRLRRDTFYIITPERRLCFLGALRDQDARELSDLFPDYRVQITRAAIQSADVQRQLSERPYSYSDLSFGKSVNLQLVNFYHDLETQFHHYFQYLNPIKEFALGRPLSQINAPYGLSFLLPEIAMSSAGSVTFQSFIATMFIFQAIYVAGFVWLVHWLFRSWPSTLGVTAVLVGSITGLGVNNMFQGFGYGPYRHGLDIATIGLFALYLRKLDGRVLFAAIVAAALNVGLDRFVGAFCGTALAATLVLRSLTGITPRTKLEFASGALIGFLILVEFFVIGQLTAPNPYAEQFFEGVWGFPISQRTLFIFLGWLFVAMAIVIWSNVHRPDQRKSLSVFLLAYSLLFAFYWLMVPNFGHLYKVFPYVALATVAVWHDCIDRDVSSVTQRRIGQAGVVLSLLVWAQLSRFMVSTGINTFSYFNSHKIYQWNFERFKAKSTMNPAAFVDSVALIKKFTSDTENVSILSEYDSILLFLSDRVSGMPHFEVGTFLNSPKHSDLVVDDIRLRQPATLIVDSCIHCSPAPYRPVLAVPYLNSAYLTRALEKVDRLQRLHDVFEKIEQDYALVETGPLVSVWRRK